MHQLHYKCSLAICVQWIQYCTTQVQIEIISMYRKGNFFFFFRRCRLEEQIKKYRVNGANHVIVYTNSIKTEGALTQRGDSLVTSICQLQRWKHQRFSLIPLISTIVTASSLFMLLIIFIPLGSPQGYARITCNQYRHISLLLIFYINHVNYTLMNFVNRERQVELTDPCLNNAEAMM